MKTIRLAAVVLISAFAVSGGAAVTESALHGALYPLADINIKEIKAMGPGVLPHLAKIYSKASDDEKASIAWVFYSLGWKSPEARAVLLKDVGTPNEKLRLQVQWALGRVSDDTEVVDLLAEIMRNDSNALFRDKAACALAYDQIHLTERQKVRLFGKLIDGLSDPKPQVRAISIQALQIHTGQTKRFQPDASASERSVAVASWQRWLQEYERNLK